MTPMVRDLRLGLRGGKDDVDVEILADVHETVRHAGGHEDDRPWPDRSSVVADLEPGASGDHQVELVLAVRPLRIRAPGGQAVEARAHRGTAQELVVEATARCLCGPELDEVEGVRGRRR
jgi:hypothetical protein